MKYTLCPYCQLNYIDDNQTKCVVCNQDRLMHNHDDRELCPYCNKNMILSSQPMCDYCWCNRHKDI